MQGVMGAKSDVLLDPFKNKELLQTPSSGMKNEFSAHGAIRTFLEEEDADMADEEDIRKRLPFTNPIGAAGDSTPAKRSTNAWGTPTADEGGGGGGGVASMTPVIESPHTDLAAAEAARGQEDGLGKADVDVQKARDAAAGVEFKSGGEGEREGGREELGAGRRTGRDGGAEEPKTGAGVYASGVPADHTQEAPDTDNPGASVRGPGAAVAVDGEGREAILAVLPWLDVRARKTTCAQ